MTLSVKKTVHDEYELIEALSNNEHYEIWLAKRISDNRKVVLKQSVSQNGEISHLSKLGHEFDVLKDLDHTGILKAYDFIFDGKKATLVLEYINGADIRNRVFKKKPGFLEVIDLAIQIAGVLQYLHLKGIIHKDINPRNLMVDSDGKIKLIDFGISSNLHLGTNDLLNPDKIEGTLNYISPEQTGRTAYSVTYSSDFYSLGILLYEMLAGKLPFDSVDPLEVIHFHLSRKPLPLSAFLKDLPDGLEQVINKLLEKDPDDRYHSSAGLKADLELIKTHFLEGKKMDGFKPGLKDVTRQYKQTQKLYGREKEINKLLGFYSNLHMVKSLLVLVAGYSGVGKSALIRHIKFPVIQKNGTFISGKFDQFKKDIPYYAFIEAIKEFIKNLLAEPEEKITEWKNRFISALGNNARLITDVIPQLSLIIGNQPPVSKLQPAEQESRFNMVLLDFIYVFSTAESPLVIFLDDLQWADLPSLNLLKRIPENPRDEWVMIIGSYRDNEVDKGHPLSITLKQLGESGAPVKSIQLEPLDQETTIRITADSFGMNDARAKELGSHVYAKTKGNPFFIHSFLKSLFEKNLVRNDLEKHWTWDHAEIEKLGYTDNVIDLMTQGLTSLPLQTQETLQYASVLGNTFNIADLAHIVESSLTMVFNDLKPAINGGYINSTDIHYRTLALQLYQLEPLQNIQDETIQFTFLHDKVQQAAYNLIPENNRPSVHLKIGRLLLKNKNQTQLSEDIFEVLNHFVISLFLIDSKEEKMRIAELCLTAGQKAKDSASYSLGVHFLTVARNILGNSGWAEHYNLAYNVNIELGECEYLNNNPDKAELYFREILGYSKTRFEKLKVYYIHSSLYLKMGNTAESLRLGLEVARLYNIRYPKNKFAIQIRTLLTLAKYLLLFSTKYKNPESLFHLKDCNDAEIIALNKFLIDLATSAYQQDQNLMMLVIFKIIKFYIKHGFTDASGWGFSGFSVVVLSALKMQKRGFNLWDITLKLHQRTASPLIKWRLSYTVLCFHNHWRIPYRNGYENILETIKACILNGDQIFTSYSVALYLRSRLNAGENLKEILNSAEDHLELIKNAKGGFDFFLGFYQLVKALSGQTPDNFWNDDSFNENETLERLKKEGNKTKLAMFYSAKCNYLYLVGKYTEALAESRKLTEYSDNFLGDMQEVSLAFYTALSISACFEDLNETDKKKYLKEFKKHLKNIELWEKGCSENFVQHRLLLQAELSGIENDTEKALLYYGMAVEKAVENRFRHIEAIACERAAIFCTKTGLKIQKQFYAKLSWNACYHWGALAKCKLLEENFPDLANKQFNPGTAEKNSITGTIFSSKSALDLATVMKASQSIASQVKYDNLLRKLMHIIIENAGAEKGCLFLYKGNQLCIEAVGISGSPDIEIYPSVPLSELEIAPVSLLNYSIRLGETVVLDDAINEGTFTTDPYIMENGILSVMCLPISTVGKIIGLLYLENKLIKGVFNKNRTDLLQMLSGQIGISIENSLLYSNLEEKVKERTKEIEKTLAELKATQTQLIQAEKMASLGELTAGVAHEIQNPLNFVNNFSEINNELIEELKEELATGNLQLANEIAADIKQNLEKISNHGKRADAIVKGMLQHSRTNSGQKEPTDINALAHEYLRLSYHGLKAKDKSFNASYETDFDPNLPKIEVVPQDIGRVLLNLINNAFYAVDKRAKDGHPLPLKGGYEERAIEYKPMIIVSTISLKSPSGDLGVKINVKDNGPGIPDSIRDKIFQPFFTTKPTGQGTGLGLSLSYDIVKAHGGEIKVNTKENEGTEFTFILPFNQG